MSNYSSCKSKNPNDFLVDISNYKIKEKISKGSYGTVYTIYKDNDNCHYLAAKVLDDRTDDQRREIERRREIQMLMKLQHPTIIKFFGYSLEDFNHKKKLTLLMEYAENGSLSSFLKKYRANQLDDSIVYDNTTRQIILIGIARGMMYIHQHDSIHRDLKPENILLDKNLHPHIADFGLSKEINPEESGKQSRFNSTPLYMAPEILDGKTYNRKVDVYAFGLIMYYIVLDTEPFSSITGNDEIRYYRIFNKACEGKRPEFTKPIKKSLKKLIEQCWHQEPNKRPSFEVIFKKLSYNIEEPDYNLNESFNISNSSSNDLNESFNSNYSSESSNSDEDSNDSSNDLINFNNGNDDYFLDNVDQNKIINYLKIVDNKGFYTNMHIKKLTEKLRMTNSENEKMKHQITNLVMQIQENNYEQEKKINALMHNLETQMKKEIEAKLLAHTNQIDEANKKDKLEKQVMLNKIQKLEQKIEELTNNNKKQDVKEKEQNESNKKDQKPKEANKKEQKPNEINKKEQNIKETNKKEQRLIESNIKEQEQKETNEKEQKPNDINKKEQKLIESNKKEQEQNETNNKEQKSKEINEKEQKPNDINKKEQNMKETNNTEQKLKEINKKEQEPKETNEKEQNLIEKTIKEVIKCPHINDIHEITVQNNLPIIQAEKIRRRRSCSQILSFTDRMLDLSQIIQVSKFNNVTGRAQAEIFRWIFRKQGCLELVKDILIFFEKCYEQLYIKNKEEKRDNSDQNENLITKYPPYVKIVCDNDNQKMIDFSKQSDILPNLIIMQRGLNLLSDLFKQSNQRNKIDTTLFEQYDIVISNINFIEFEYSPDNFKDLLNYIKIIKENRKQLKTILKFTNIDEVPSINDDIINIIKIDSVNSIKKKCFENLQSLVAVSINGSKNTQLGNEIFLNCKNLKFVTISGFEIITESMFSHCSSLSSIEMPSSVKEIREKAFKECSNLKAVTFKGDVTKIHKYAFEKCNSLKEITINSEIIGNHAFYSCKSLEKVTLTTNVKVIENNAFFDCAKLINITIPKSVTNICECAFNNCTNLSSVLFDDNSIINEIGDRAFQQTKLKKITIPQSVTKIGKNVFNLCTELVEVYLYPSLNIDGIGLTKNQIKIINEK